MSLELYAFRTLGALAIRMALGGLCATAIIAQAQSGIDPASASSPAADTVAQNMIEQAQRFEHAEGVNRDFARAHELYCEAALRGSADAFLRLGWMYANGRGIARDDSVAGTLFRRSATLGNEMAARLAGMIRGDVDKLPACFTTTKAASSAPEPAVPASSKPVTSSLPTPVAQNPADFRHPAPAAERKRLIDLVLKLSPEYRLDPRLVLALISQESNFDILARSPRNAQGLMQLIPETAERFAVADVWDPVSNLRGGMSYLRWLLAYFKGDVAMSLAGYNAGEGAVDKFRGIPPFGETMAYVQRIRSVYPFDRHPFDKSLNVRLSAQKSGAKQRD